MSRVVRGVVGVVGELLVTAGLFCLLFVAWQLWWTDVAANATQSRTVERLDALFAGTPKALDPNGMPSGLLAGDAFAVVHIPRFGADWARPVLEGTGPEILKEGLGHYVGTVGPGKVGNFAMAGHRTTYGRPFHDVESLRDGDRIIVETATGWFVYEVSGHEIVAPTDVAVVAPVPGSPGEPAKSALLTLTTCHPMYTAQQRYVVHARLAGTFTRAQGLPASYLTVPVEVS